MIGIVTRCNNGNDDEPLGTSKHPQHRRKATAAVARGIGVSFLLVQWTKLLMRSSRNPYRVVILVILFQVIFVYQLAVHWNFSTEEYNSGLASTSTYALSSKHLIPTTLVKIYESVRRERASPLTRSDPIEQSCPPSLLLPGYGPQISCNLTVVVMDPRLGNASAFPTFSLWFSLESIAFLFESSSSNVCVALLTLPCVSEQRTRDVIYSKALPLFRYMIDQQRVRVGFLHSQYYNLPSSSSSSSSSPCDYHTNPTAILLHSKFWIDEFTPQDSDLVLMMQDDAVVCHRDYYHFIHNLSLLSWAYVGAVWPPHATRTFPLPEQGLCLQIPSLWYSWTRPQRQWFLRNKQNPHNNKTNMSLSSASLSSPVPPFQVLSDKLDLDCSQKGIVGNGGFSLKSRAWMTKVIDTCPHVKYSGKMDFSRHACKVLDEIQEDVYFSTVLHGLQAPLPSLTQAAEFAVEGLFREDVLVDDDNNNENVDASQSTNAHRRNAAPQIQVQGKKLTIPFGFHKPWWYLPKDLLTSPEMEEACPFLRYMLDPLIFDK